MTQNALEDLQGLGFTEYEARAYVALLENGTLTGYQLAKESGIPRPNIYAVLDKLQQRGAVVPVQVKDGVRYAALPAKEMLARLGTTLQRRLQGAEAHLELAQEKAPAASVWNLQGYENILDRASELAGRATTSLLLGVWAEESRHLGEATARAMGRGIEVTTLCIQGCPQECGNCRGSVYRYPIAGEAEKRWLVVVADERELLVAQVSPEGGSVGAITTLEVVTAVGSLFLKNCIAAAEIVRSLGTELPRLLDSQAREALRSAGLSVRGNDWFDSLYRATLRAPTETN